MRIATLSLALADEKIIFNVIGGPGGPFTGPSFSAAEKLHEKLDQFEYGDPTERSKAILRLVEKLRRSEFGGWWGQWVADRTPDSVVCVYSDVEKLSTLPWSEILLPVGSESVNAAVAHVCNLKGKVPSQLTPPVSMLLAGWTNLTGQEMRGCVRELQEFPGKVDHARLVVRPLAEPKRTEFLEACGKNAAFVQMSPPSLIKAAGTLAIPVAKQSATGPEVQARAKSFTPDFEAVSIDDVTTALKKNQSLRLVVLNACYAGLAGCGQIATTLNVPAIGWPALVGDDIAADFTFFFYQRLLESFTPLSAARAFYQILAGSANAVEVPTVWLPSPEWADWKPFSALVEPEAEVRAGPSAKGKRKTVSSPAGKTEAPPVPAAAPAPPAPGLPPGLAATSAAPLQSARLEFRPRASINPALLFNGLHPIEYISIESPGEEEVHLRIECDTGSHISTFRQTVQLRKGVVPINSTEIHFPALHELIGHHTGRRRVSFTATLSRPDGTEISGQTRTVQWMGAKEWLDQQDTWAFVPAFVNPYDTGVLKVFEHANQVLRTLGDPGDNFSGYASTNRPDYVSTQMKSIFQTLRDDAIGLTYISPPGSPVFDTTSKRACGQVIRTHAEVVERKLGTCQDLTLLLAACAEYVNIRPLVLLAPGHTYAGYWLSSTAQEKYWKDRSERLRTSQYGEGWMMTEAEPLVDLLNRDQIRFVEATYLCQRQKTFQNACDEGARRFREKDKDTFDVVIDIYQARREIQPL